MWIWRWLPRNLYCKIRYRFKKQEDIKSEIDNKSANNLLWSMSFDGSCTKRNAGVRVWLHNNENNICRKHSKNLLVGKNTKRGGESVFAIITVIFFVPLLISIHDFNEPN